VGPYKDEDTSPKRFVWHQPNLFNQTKCIIFGVLFPLCRPPGGRKTGPGATLISETNELF
jgi:hypothetical protein